jgi:hypothetical protein
MNTDSHDSLFMLLQFHITADSTAMTYSETTSSSESEQYSDSYSSIAHSFFASSIILIVVGMMMSLCVSASAQLQLPRSVVSGGGRATTSQTMQMNSTVGQTAIGRISSPTLNHNVGFWYTVRSLLGVPSGTSLIMLPNVVADIGVRINVPLIILQSTNLERAKAKNFEAVLRYNIHVLEALSSSCVRTNDSCRITVTGSIGASDTLITLPFLTKLGNAEYSPLVIESFRWVDAPSVSVTMRDGRVDFTGICHEGGTTRLVFTTQQTAITQVAPNPASSNTTVTMSLGKRGATELTLVDMNGRTVATLFVNPNAGSGTYTIPYSLNDIASGNYYLMLRTPTQFLSYPMVVQK